MNNKKHGRCYLEWGVGFPLAARGPCDAALQLLNVLLQEPRVQGVVASHTSQHITEQHSNEVKSATAKAGYRFPLPNTCTLET